MCTASKKRFSKINTRPVSFHFPIQIKKVYFNQCQWPMSFIVKYLPRFSYASLQANDIRICKYMMNSFYRYRVHVITPAKCILYIKVGTDGEIFSEHQKLNYIKSHMCIHNMPTSRNWEISLKVTRNYLFLLDMRVGVSISHHAAAW